MIASPDWGHALSAFWNGAFGTSFGFFSATLVRATPLAILGLAVSLSFRAGLLNIGADGQFLAGAAAASAVALAGVDASSALVIPAMIVAGVLAGAGWAAVAAQLRRRFGVLEVISTLLLNFVALHFVAWLVRGPLQEPSGAFPQTATFGASGRWPLLLPGSRVHVGFLMAVVLAGTLWWVLVHTAAGFRVRVVGASVRAAESAAGIDIGRTHFAVFLSSGALAGLAGAAEVGGVTWALYEGISPGYGYTAIAVALLARLDARGIVPSAILFGGLQAGAAAMQRDAGVPSTIVLVVVSLVILGVLLAARVREAARTRSRQILATSA